MCTNTKVQMLHRSTRQDLGWRCANNPHSSRLLTELGRTSSSSFSPVSSTLLAKYRTHTCDQRAWLAFRCDFWGSESDTHEIFILNKTTSQYIDTDAGFYYYFSEFCGFSVRCCRNRIKTVKRWCSASSRRNSWFSEHVFTITED